MTWFKVVNSRGFIEHIELRDSTIVSIEKYTNMLDVILKREPRTFKITYFLEGDKIHHQIIDTLNGYNALLKRNNEKLDLFNNFCMDNSYEFSMKMNQKDGQKLKRLLHLYRKENLE